jgi:hypothetical protein
LDKEIGLIKTNKKKGLEKLGYDTFMVFVNTTLKVALERNRNRWFYTIGIPKLNRWKK